MKCSESFTQKDLIPHLKDVCKFHIIKCPKCDVSLKRCELESHDCFTYLSEKLAQNKSETEAIESQFGIRSDILCSVGHVMVRNRGPVINYDKYPKCNRCF